MSTTPSYNKDMSPSGVRNEAWASPDLLLVFIELSTWLFILGGRGEGPRSRCYGRTAALRLIVQPCDEDD
jgi:hypothetical protein